MERIGDLVIVNATSELSKIKNLKYRVLVQSLQNRTEYRVPEYRILDSHLEHSVTNRHWFAKFKKYQLKISELKTVHLENGFYFYLDLAKGYFNTRYCEYRKNLFYKIKNRLVTVLFNGYGPYLVYLAKQNSFVSGYDANPNCEPYVKINTTLNGIRNYFVYTQIVEQTLKFYRYSDVIVSILPMGILKYFIAVSKLDYAEHYCLMGLNRAYIPLFLRIFITFDLKIKEQKLVKLYNIHYPIFGFLFLRVHGRL